MPSKRDERRKLGANWLTETQESADVTARSPQSVASEGYGLLNVKEPTWKTKSISIFNIQPDHQQPRRAFPLTMRQAAQEHAGSDDPQTLFAYWCDQLRDVLDVRAVIEDGGVAEHFDVAEADAVMRAPENAAPEVIAMLHIADLAASIRRDKLANPITVARLSDTTYRIETGERRWLAYHLLHYFYPEADFSEIPARVVDSFNVWRQAAENGARNDLNAIGRARQFALLLMDLIGAEAFQPIDAFPQEQGFYAQVVEMPTPYGKAPLILSAMGVTHRNAINRYREILKLPGAVWQWADDYSWTENRLRALYGLAEAEAIALAETWLSMAADDELSPTGDNSDSAAVPEALSPVAMPAAVRAVERGLGMLDKLSEKKLRDLDGEARQAMRERLAAYRRRLEEIEAWLD
ncbi:MAG: hypothetical protein OHK0046_49670 [Anaerolineae bacterium]